MILYNYRYRGPYEYDKFTINTLQFFNKAQNMIQGFEKMSFLGHHKKELDSYIDLLTGTDCKLHKIMLISDQLI